MSRCLTQIQGIIIKSAKAYQTDEGPWAASPTTASPGLGAFGSKDDKDKIQMILEQVMKRLLRHCLRSQDMARYRTYLNLHKVAFTGFGRAPSIEDVLPKPSVQDAPATIFLRQNYFKKVTEVDASGYSPLCYAALNGDPLLIQSLLEARASPNTKTQKWNQRMNTGPGMTVLGLAAWFGNKEAVSVLIGARADVNEGLLSPLHFAASANQTACIKLLSSSKGLPNTVGPSGLSPLGFACLQGQTDAVQELISAGVDLSGALFSAGIHAGNAEVVVHLVEAKADLNERWKPTGILKWALRLHHWIPRCNSERNVVVDLAHHCWGATPLICAVICGQDEVAAALIAAGARMDLQNSQGKTAMDLASERSSEFVIGMLQGETQMQDIVRIAVSNRYPVSHMF